MSLRLIVKHFSALSVEELRRIYALRIAVFVVEQQCPYQDIDEADRVAYHLWLEDDDGIQAYARALPRGVTFSDCSIGRVISVRRHCGLGMQIVQAAMQTAKEQFGAERITIEAQTYARGLYEKVGFRQISEEFLEDGIPHILMQANI